MANAATERTPPLMPGAHSERGAALMAQFRSELNQDSTLDPTLDMSGDLGEEAEDFGGLLRVRQKEMEVLENQNMELKMQVYNLRKELSLRAEAERRISGHGFYDFDDERRGSNSRRGSTTADLTEILQLRESLAVLERKYTMLEVETKKERRAAESIAAKAEQEHQNAERIRKQNEILAKQLDTAHSERMMHKADKDVLRAAAAHAESKLGVVEGRLRDAEKRAATAAETVRTVSEQVEKERKRVAEADKRVDRMREAVSLLETSARRSEIQQQELAQNAAKARTEADGAKAALDSERRRSKELEMELRVANERLVEEKMRAEVEHAAKEHACKNHAGKGLCPDAFRLPPMAQLEELIGNFNVRRILSRCRMII